MGSIKIQLNSDAIRKQKHEIQINCKDLNLLVDLNRVIMSNRQYDPNLIHIYNYLLHTPLMEEFSNLKVRNRDDYELKKELANSIVSYFIDLYATSSGISFPFEDKLYDTAERFVNEYYSPE